MELQSRDKWNPDFLLTSPLYFPLEEITKLLTYSRHLWPGLDDFQNLLSQLPSPPTSQRGRNIRFVQQALRHDRWTEEYEPRIFLTGEVQTRTENWHDFFQVLIWAVFAQTKAVLNAKHYHAIAQRKSTAPQSTRRSAVENALTQFDECGAIVVSTRSDLLQFIRDFRWKELFWSHRYALQQHLKCFVFGHAIYEKALDPYLGLTAHAVLVTVTEEFFHWPLNVQLNHLDNTVATQFDQDYFTSPKDLQPFPLLGMPAWDKNNHLESYYDNVSYFRPGRFRR